MRIFYDPARDDYRMSVDKYDANDVQMFTVTPNDDPLAQLLVRRLIALAQHHQPPANMSNRRSWALALMRMLAYLYGEDISDDPEAPCLSRLTMRQALERLSGLPTTEHDPEDEALNRQLLSETFGSRCESRPAALTVCVVEMPAGLRAMRRCGHCRAPATWSIQTHPRSEYAAHACDECRAEAILRVQRYVDAQAMGKQAADWAQEAQRTSRPPTIGEAFGEL